MASCTRLRLSARISAATWNSGTYATSPPYSAIFQACGASWSRAKDSHEEQRNTSKAHNISLHVARPPKDGDAGPRIKATLVVMTIPRVREVEFDVNDAWLAGNSAVRDRIQEGP